MPSLFYSPGGTFPSCSLCSLSHQSVLFASSPLRWLLLTDSLSFFSPQHLLSLVLPCPVIQDRTFMAGVWGELFCYSRLPFLVTILLSFFSSTALPPVIVLACLSVFCLCIPSSQFNLVSISHFSYSPRPANISSLDSYFHLMCM